MPHFSLTCTTQPPDEPLSLAEAKAHIRIPDDVTFDDSWILEEIKAAREAAELITWRALITQSWKLYLDAFPCYADWTATDPDSARHYDPAMLGAQGDAIVVPRPPLQSVESIKYVDGNGVEQTLSPSAYQIDKASEPARIVPAYGAAWPSTRAGTPNAVTVAFTCGFGAEASDVPAGIRAWIKVRVATKYRNREEFAMQGRPEILPFIDGALLPWRVKAV